jgi:hypothetical protein
LRAFSSLDSGVDELKDSPEGFKEDVSDNSPSESYVEVSLSMVVLFGNSMEVLDPNPEVVPEVECKKDAEDSSEGSKEVGESVAASDLLEGDDFQDSANDEDAELDEDLVLDQHIVLFAFVTDGERVSEDPEPLAAEVGMVGLLQELLVDGIVESSVSERSRYVQTNHLDDSSSEEEPDESGEVEDSLVKELLASESGEGIEEHEG